MCFIALPEFISSGGGKLKHAAHNRDHQFFFRGNNDLEVVLVIV
jgi:hypothetical protein